MKLPIKTAAALIASAAYLLLNSNLSAQNVQCNIPSNLYKPKIAKTDCQNKTNADYYLLALSWSPQFCYEMRGKGNADVQMQCKDNKFGFVVHGLWPQKINAKNKCDQPRNCNNSIIVSDNIIKQNLCMVPGVNLIQNEWQKHGSCAFSSPDNYYAATTKLWNNLKKPDLIALQNSKHNLTVGDVEQAFIKENPKLAAKNINIEMNSGRYLKEVRICYDLNLNYRECERKGTPAHLSIKIGQ